MRQKKDRWAWWSVEHIDDRGFPLCAVLRPAHITEQDTDEMTEVQLNDAFTEADWPFNPADSWADDT